MILDEDGLVVVQWQVDIDILLNEKTMKSTQKQKKSNLGKTIEKTFCCKICNNKQLQLDKMHLKAL